MHCLLLQKPALYTMFSIGRYNFFAVINIFQREISFQLVWSGEKFLLLVSAVALRGSQNILAL